MSLLSVNNLCTAFYTREGRMQAVDGLSFELEKGELLGIVGESGSGKSVSCYSLLGLVPSPPGKVESGSALFNGQDLLKMSERELRSVRGSAISMIFQDPMTSLNPFMKVGDQIVEVVRQHRNLDNKAAKRLAIESLEHVGIREASKRVDSYPHEFSGGMRQRVMIAMALINEPELLIADEPTTALDVTVQAQILDLIKDLQKSHGLAVVFITHDLGVVSKIADNILVMQKGKVVESGATQKLFSKPEHPYTQKLLSAIPTTAKPYPQAFSDSDIDLLEVKNLNTVFEQRTGLIVKKVSSRVVAVDDISLTIKRGEIFGLVGESGSGKSTLGRSILRLVDSQSGEVILDGERISDLDDKSLLKARRSFQMIFQDPYASLNPRMTVFDTLAEPLLKHKIVAKKEVLKAVNELMDDVGLDRKMIRKYPHEFSGGQRQRIAIARALALRPKLIIADEPVSALDVTIQAQVLELLMMLTRKHGLTMLFISHDLSVVRYICDRVAVMQHGKLVEVGQTEEIYHNPQQPYTQKLLSAIPKVDV